METQKLNSRQELALQQLAKRVKDCAPPGRAEDLLMWLVAREFNVNKAEAMYRKALEWRRANQVDQVLSWQRPLVLSKYFHQRLCGRDKLGCPLWLNGFGKLDIRGLLQSVSKEDYIKNVVFYAEQSAAMAQESDVLCKKSTFIVDLQGLSYSQFSYKPGVEVGMELVRITEAYYPETCRRIFIINAPKVFSVAFKIIAPFLSETTRQKIRVLDKEAALFEEIDTSQLPPRLGGTNEDPSLSEESMSAQVPKEFYLAADGAPQLDDCVSVLAGERVEFKFEAKAPGAVLRWEFCSESGDIGWAISFDEEADRRVDVIARQRIDCGVFPHQGKILCKRIGTYVAEFDNTHSYFRSKKVWFSIVLEHD